MPIQTIKRKIALESKFKAKFDAPKSPANYGISLWRDCEDCPANATVVIKETEETAVFPRAMRRLLCNNTIDNDKFLQCDSTNWKPFKTMIWSLNDGLLLEILSYLRRKEWAGFNSCHSLLNIYKKLNSYQLKNTWLYLRILNCYSWTIDEKNGELKRVKLGGWNFVLQQTNALYVAKRVLYDGDILSGKSLASIDKIFKTNNSKSQRTGTMPLILGESPQAVEAKSTSNKPDLAVTVAEGKSTSNKPDVPERRVYWFHGITRIVGLCCDLLSLIYFAKTCYSFYTFLFQEIILRECAALQLEKFTSTEAERWVKLRPKGPLNGFYGTRYLLRGVKHLECSHDFYNEYCYAFTNFDARNIVVYTGAIFKLAKIGPPLKIVEFKYDFIMNHNSDFWETRWMEFKHEPYRVPIYIISQDVHGEYPRLPFVNVVIFHQCNLEITCLVTFVNYSTANCFIFNECDFHWPDEEILLLNTPRLSPNRGSGKALYLINVRDYEGALGLLTTKGLFDKYFGKFVWKMNVSWINGKFWIPMDCLSHFPPNASPKKITIIVEYPKDYQLREGMEEYDPEAPEEYQLCDTELLWSWIEDNWIKINQCTSIISFIFVLLSVNINNFTDTSGLSFNLKDIANHKQLTQIKEKWFALSVRQIVSDPTVALLQWDSIFKPIKQAIKISDLKQT